MKTTKSHAGAPAESAEKAAVERMLAFANMPRVDDAASVYELFGVRDTGLWRRVGEREFAPLQERLTDPEPDAATILESDRKQCVEILAQVAVDVRRARERDGPRVRELLAKALLLGVPEADARWRVTLNFRPISGVEAAYGYALALLFDPFRRWGAALKRCPLVSCRVFHLNIRGPGERGRPKQFCCVPHQLEFDKAKAVERAKEWRAARPRKPK